MNSNRKYGSKDEYEMQCYYMHSDEIYDWMHDLVIHKIQKQCGKIQRSMEKFNRDEEILNKIPKIFNELNEKYTTNATPHLVKMKKRINEIFRIPENILLPEDAKQEIQYDEPNMEYFKFRNNTLLEQLIQDQAFQVALKEELNHLNKAEQLYNLDEFIDNIETTLKHQESWDKKKNMDFVNNLNQLQKNFEKIGPRTMDVNCNPDIDQSSLKKLD